jgi:uncharacterized protein (DUF433 family)
MIGGTVEPVGLDYWISPRRPAWCHRRVIFSVVYMDVGVRAELAAAVRMNHYCPSRGAQGDRVAQCRDCQGGLHAGVHRVAGDPPREGVLDRAQVELVFGGGVLGDVSQPQLIGPVRGELAVDQLEARRRASLAAVLRRTTMNYMSQPLSIRLNDATISRLGARARRAHLPPRTLAQRYVEEGLRMDEHPLIRFADGPAGRRARVLGTGKDVWEVIAVVRDNGGDAAGSARYLEIPLGLIQAAIAYYGAYSTEIDQQIEANEQESAEAHGAYLAGQAALRR